MSLNLTRSLFRGTSLSSRLHQDVKPLINKNLVAHAWVGSYRIRNPDKFLDQFPKPSRWPRYNEMIKPPQTDPSEDKRPATYYHHRENIKHSPKKMWYVVKFMRGLSVDEAVKQLRFMPYKGAQLAADTLLEAQQKAVQDHNFEFKSNMWIADARCGKGLVIKGIRKNARMRFSTITYFYCHLMIKLVEGQPPVHYYRPPKDGNDLLKDYYDELRSRKVDQGL